MLLLLQLPEYQHHILLLERDYHHFVAHYENPLNITLVKHFGEADCLDTEYIFSFIPNHNTHKFSFVGDVFGIYEYPYFTGDTVLIDMIASTLLYFGFEFFDVGFNYANNTEVGTIFLTSIDCADRQIISKRG